MYNTDYPKLHQKLQSLLGPETHWLANLSNTAALLFQTLEGINWVGFYLLQEEELILGPFQGKPACVRIPLGEGVCGTAAQSRQLISVADVHEFPGHIACDPASRSELVIPMLTPGGRLLGVLDVDSPFCGRFSEEDCTGLAASSEILISNSHWPEPLIA